MKIKFHKKENQGEMEIEVPVEMVKISYDKILKDVSKKINIKGFRKGKAPISIIESNINKEALYKDVIEDLIPNAYEEALYIENINPITQPEFHDIGEFSLDKPFTFKVKFEVKPEIELKHYKDFEIDQEKFVVDEDVLNKTIESMRKRSSRLVDIEEDRGIQEGDFAVVDFESYIEGGKKPQRSFKKGLIQIKNDPNWPGLAENIIGKKKDETAEFTVSSKEGEENSAPVKFKIKIYEIKNEVLPELNDDFAKQVSKFDTFGELKENIRKNLEQVEDNRAKQEAENKILEKIVEKYEEIVSENMINYQTMNILHDLQKQLNQRKLKFDDYLKMRNIDYAKLIEETKPQAERFAKVDLAIDAIARQENIEVTEKDMQEDIDAYAKETNQQPDSIREQMDKNRTFNVFKSNLLRKKVLEFLLEKNKVNYEMKKREDHSHEEHIHA